MNFGSVRLSQTAAAWPRIPNRETRDPKLETNTDRGGERADGDRDRSRRTAEQDRLGQ
jgi:hypothetical protein